MYDWDIIMFNQKPISLLDAKVGGLYNGTSPACSVPAF